MRTWEQLTELEQLHTIYSDLHKDACGYRPRHSVSDWTVEDFEKEFERLHKICEENAREEAIAEQKAMESVEATIAGLIAKGAKSREQAIQWMAQAEGAVFENALQFDPDYLCYLLGVPYGYFGC